MYLLFTNTSAVVALDNEGLSSVISRTRTLSFVVILKKKEKKKGALSFACNCSNFLFPLRHSSATDPWELPPPTTAKPYASSLTFSTTKLSAVDLQRSLRTVWEQRMSLRSHLSLLQTKDYSNKSLDADCSTLEWSLFFFFFFILLREGMQIFFSSPLPHH